MFQYNPDNKILQTLSLYFDLVVLAAVWTAASLPIITVGASTTALYQVLFRMQVGDGVAHPVRLFFRCCRSEWRQGTAVWALLLVFLALAGSDLLICAVCLPEGAAGVILWAGGLLAGLLALCLLVYVFPVNARFNCTVRQVFANAVHFAAANPGQTLALGVLLALMGASVLLLWALAAFALGPLLYLSAKRLRIIFAPVVRQYEEEF